MKMIYVCSPCRGDYENNLRKAREYSRVLAEWGYMPITPHIYFTQFLDDSNPCDREKGMRYGMKLLLMCDELWAFGLDHPSEGMAEEIKLATRCGIPVRDGCAELNSMGYGVDPDDEDSKPDEEPEDIGSVVINLPGMSIVMDGDVVLDLADRLMADPGTTIDVEYGGDGD